MVRKKKKIGKGFGILLIILFIIAGVTVASIIGIFKQESFGSNVFVRPIWDRLECSPEDTYDYDTDTVQTGSGTYIKCADDEFTDECRVKVELESVGNLADLIIWQKCGTNNICSTENRQSVSGLGGDRGEYSIPGVIKAGESYKIQCKEDQIISRDKQCNAKIEFKRWHLYRYDGSAKYEQKNENCDVLSSLKSSILQTDYVGSLKMTGGIGQKWINFISGWVYSPAVNIYTHPQYGRGYCQAPNFYEIIQVRLADGQLAQIDPKTNTQKEDGTSFNGAGRILGAVQCCPGEAGCGQDFKFSGTTEGQSCISDGQCWGGGQPVPIGNKQYVKYQCISNKCTKSAPISVECTQHSDCPIGLNCDLTLTNYGKCVQQSGNGGGGGTRPNPEDDDLIIAIIIIGAILLLIIILGSKKKPQVSNPQAPIQPIITNK